MEKSYTCGILTVSDKGADGTREDTSGPALADMLASRNTFQVVKRAIIADEKEKIKKILGQWSDRECIDLILTTGGTGVSPRDVTPEATREILEKEIPGICEAMRRTSLDRTPHAILSRAAAGIRKSTLIINLPGSLQGARENLASILEALPHAIYKIKGGSADCGK